MPDLRSVPIPGSARARLLDAGIHRFQQQGYERASVVEIAREAGVTTGSLYHHFGSKLGLFLAIRDEMEKRMTERMEGAFAASSGGGRAATRVALEVAFDAAVRFGVTRILAEPRPDDQPDAVAALLAGSVPEPAPVAPMLAAVWRAALLAVADGTDAAEARTALRWVLDSRG